MTSHAWGAWAVAIAIAMPGRASAEPPRPYEGTTEVDAPTPTPTPTPTQTPTPTPTQTQTPTPTPTPTPATKTRGTVPLPVVPRSSERIRVAIGLSPAAPGTKIERDLLRRLERSTIASIDPRTDVRRLRPGVGEARQICRDRRDDLVLLLGYVPDREQPVVLAHDCRLDAALPVRPAEAVDETGLVGVLWAEHHELVRKGAKERRMPKRLTNAARAGIAAGVAIIVIGVAVGVLVANALRDEKVVLKVSP